MGSVRLLSEYKGSTCYRAWAPESNTWTFLCLTGESTLRVGLCPSYMSHGVHTTHTYRSITWENNEIKLKFIYEVLLKIILEVL